MKILIVGGCFTDQHNIPFDLLYHQTLKRKLTAKIEHVEIRTIRYERISACLNKIIALQKDYKFDLLVFHLRAEPLMRMAKLYYKYRNIDGKLKRSLNLPGLNIFYPEKFDLLSQRRLPVQNHQNHNESRFHHFLREANYILGSIIGNKSYALKMLKSSVLKMQDFCAQNQVKLLLLGPVSRPFSSFENHLSEKIHKEFNELVNKVSINYLNLLKTKTTDQKPMFFENGIHVSQAGHHEIANMIYRKLITDILLLTSQEIRISEPEISGIPVKVNY